MASPLSPQIKVPPVSPMPTGKSSALPYNLPTGEVREVFPPTTKASITPLKPTVPSPAPVSGQAPVFKSSIRTMQEDLAALRKGTSPAGFQIEKQFEKDEKTSTQPPSIKPVPIVRALPHMELGKLEKSKPLASEPSLPPPPPSALSKIPELKLPDPSSSKPIISLPLAPSGFLGGLGGLNSRKLIWGGLGLLIIIVLVLFFLILRPSTPEVVFTPTPTATPTAVIATPGIENAFSIFSKVSFSVGVDIFDNLPINIDEGALVGGESGLYQIIDPQNGLSYSFSSFMSSALVTIPEEIIPFVDNDNFYLSLMQKVDSSYSRGFIIKLKNDVGISAVLNGWEANMSANLQTLFGLDIEQAASINLLDNTYQGVAIRYRNFPDHFLTIDYAVVTETNGDKYLVVTSSKDHIYSIIDNLR